MPKLPLFLNWIRQKCYERINTWIEAQARLFGTLKKIQIKTNKEQKDDYHNAKRYFAFIIAYNAINDCRKSSALSAL